MNSEEIQPEESGAQIITPEAAPKTRRAFSRLKRELADDELASPGVQKMLLELLAEAEEVNIDLKSFRQKFYEVDKELAVLRQKFHTKVAVEILHLATLTISAAAFVYAPVVWDHQPSGYIAVCFGTVLAVAGIAAKVVSLW